MTITVGDVIRDVVIDAIDDEGRGRGVAQDTDLAVRGALPGDTVDVVIERVWSARGLAQGRGVMRERGALHVERTCAHEGPCPACPLHGVDDSFALALKRARVEQALRDVDRVELVDKVAPAVAGGGLRQKIKLVVGDAPAGGLVLGHYVPHTHELAPASGCALADHDMRAATEALRLHLEAAGLTAYDVKAVIVRRFVEGLACIIVGQGPCPVPLDTLWPRALLRGVGWQTPRDGQSHNAVVHGDVVDVVGDIMGAPLYGDANERVSVDTFCQAEAEGAAWLVARACQFVTSGSIESAVDLYAGTGVFARGLHAAGAARVVAVESYAPSAQALSAVAPSWLTVMLGRVEDTVDIALRGVTGCVADPPKKGLGAVARALSQAKALKRIALVSCDVDAFAKDTASLVAGGFDVETIVPVDLFRGSAEVEVLTLFHRRSR